MKKIRILMTGGGSGGHIYPILSVVSELQVEALDKNVKLRIRYVGSAGRMYRELLRNNGIEVKRILGSKLRRYFSFANFIDFPKFLISLIQALWKLLWFMPDVVFSKGGPGSIPVVLVARFYRIPVVIHESDSIPSLTGRITSRFAKVIAISFVSAAKHFEGLSARIILTGNPIRTVLLKEKMDKMKAKAFVEFDVDKPLLLVLGGSQGAEFLNSFILNNLEKILHVTQIFHQTGVGNYERVVSESETLAKNLPEELKNRYKVIDYFKNDIAIAYSAADVVLSRSGAGGIFEIAAFHKPSILVPITNSANNHQMFNALEYSKSGAAIVFEEENLKPAAFLERLREFFENQEKLRLMEEATVEFYKPDAAKKLADVLLNIRSEP